MNIDTWSVKVLADMDAQLKLAALAFKDIIGRHLSVPGTGRFYKRRKGPGFKHVKVKSAGPLLRGEKRSFFTEKRRILSQYHRASAPGHTPTRDLGTLFRSRYAEKSGKEQYTVGVSAATAKLLEYGTNRMAARPFMAPSAIEFKRVFAGKFALGLLKK